jgi:hypothetical protein
MSFFDKLKKALSAPGGNSRDYWITVRCNRCGEVISTRVDLMNDLSKDFETGKYYTHKVIIGSGAARCFQKIDVSLTFDKNKRLVDHTIAGGTFLEPEEVEAAREAYQQKLAQAKAEAEARRKALEAEIAARAAQSGADPGSRTEDRADDASDAPSN